MTETGAVSVHPLDPPPAGQPRPTSQEVAEVAIEHGIKSRAYRDILSCWCGNCFHPDHQRDTP